VIFITFLGKVKMDIIYVQFYFSQENVEKIKKVKAKHNFSVKKSLLP